MAIIDRLIYHEISPYRHNGSSLSVSSKPLKIASRSLLGFGNFMMLKM